MTTCFPTPKPRLRLLGAGLALSAASALLAPAAHANQLVPQNLKQMIQAADVIVTGEVSKVTDGIDRGLPFTEVTMKVKGSVKRDLAINSNYSFRQYGLLKTRRLADGRYMLATKIEGLPTWAVGEQVVTFLNKPGERSGFRTPVGLTQGKFTASGTQLANGVNNQNLFRGVSVEPGVLTPNETLMLAKQMGAVESGVLTNLVKRAVKEQWIERGVMR